MDHLGEAIHVIAIAERFIADVVDRASFGASPEPTT